MPVDEVRSILVTSDPAARSKLILDHLSRLERQLEETQTAVVALRALLEHAETPLAVEHRTVAPTRALAITARISLPEVAAWMLTAYTEIYDALSRQGVRVAGPSGALWPTELFLEEAGDAVVFVPVVTEAQAAGRAPLHRRPRRRAGRRRASRRTLGRG